MTRHIIRRLIQAIPTVFGVTILSYLIMVLAPGDPATLLTFGLTDDENNVYRNQLIERYSLDDPWIIQYLTWIVGNDWMVWKNFDENGNPKEDRLVSYGVIRGDFGESIRQRRPVSELIGERIWATLELGTSTLIVSLLLGIPIGIGAAVFHGRLFDNATRIFAVIGNSIPNFWLGLMLLLIIGVTFDNQTIPILNIEIQTDWARGGRCDRIAASRTGCGSIPIYQRLEYLILPTLVLSLGGIAGYSRFMRTSMLDVINSDYIRTARAKGLRDRNVWFRHAARNALIPIATFLGPAIVSVIGGAVVTEAIFSWPGIGRMFLDATVGRDYPVVMAAVLISALASIIAYIISDVLYAIFDPRIRF